MTENQRHADGRLVQQLPVLKVVAPLTEALAMVGGQHDERGVECPGGLQGGTETADLDVGSDDLPVVTTDVIDDSGVLGQLLVLRG